MGHTLVLIQQDDNIIEKYTLLKLVVTVAIVYLFVSPPENKFSWS